jgi:hypothetical protein
MNEHRTAARWIAGLVLVGATLVGGVAPAQADTGWNGTVAPRDTHTSHQMRPADTGWNGT